MKKYTYYRDLYHHIVRSFYLGVYSKGDRFPTQMELVATYQVAANSIKKVFKLLLEDGFITTDRSFGTHVTFDIDNPDHLGKVPLYRPDPQGDDPDTLIVPAQLIAHILCFALQESTPDQLAWCLDYANDRLASLSRPHDLSFMDSALLEKLCENLDNSYISDYGNFFVHRFIFVRRSAYTNIALCKQAQAIGKRFYTQLRDLLLAGEPTRILQVFPDYYEALYRIPELFVFATPSSKRHLFSQQALYTQLVHKLLLYVVAKDLKKGDLLPTEHEISAQYSTSIITVRRALSILKEIGLVDGERFVGTRMQEDWNSPALQQWLARILSEQHKMIIDAIGAEYIVGQTLCSQIDKVISDQLVEDMQQALDDQWKAHQSYHAPLFMSQVFSTPVVTAVGSQLLNRCFFHVHDDLTKFLAIRLLQMSDGFSGTTDVYKSAQTAIDALRVRDFELFRSQSDYAVLHNRDLMRSAIGDAVYRYGNIRV